MLFDNIVLLSLDALRYDCVNYQPKKKIDQKLINKYLSTPTLDKLSENAICFTKAFSNSSYTTTSHASLFTGDLPPKHKVQPFYYLGEKLSHGTETLAEYFSSLGFATNMCSDFAALFENLELNRGFDHTHSYEEQLFQQISRVKSKKNFVFMHFLDVHAPFLHSPSNKISNQDYLLEINKLRKKHRIKIDKKSIKDNPYEIWREIQEAVTDHKKELLPSYLKGVTKFDQGRLKIFFETLSRTLPMDKTVVIILSDHGEGTSSFSDDSTFSHSLHLSNEVLRVPLIIYSPQIKQVINHNHIGLNQVYDLIKELPKISTAKKIKNIYPKPTLIYAETWRHNDKGVPTRPLSVNKDQFHLFERSMINKNHKLIISFSPEKIFAISSSFTNFSQLNTLMIQLGISPSRSLKIKLLTYGFLYKYLGFIKPLIKYLVKNSSQPPFILYSLDKNAQEKPPITSFKKLDQTTISRVAKMSADIFKLNKVDLNKKKILKILKQI